MLEQKGNLHSDGTTRRITAAMMIRDNLAEDLGGADVVCFRHRLQIRGQNSLLSAAPGAKQPVTYSINWRADSSMPWISAFA